MLASGRTGATPSIDGPVGPSDPPDPAVLRAPPNLLGPALLEALPLGAKLLRGLAKHLGALGNDAPENELIKVSPQRNAEIGGQRRADPRSLSGIPCGRQN